MIERKVNPDNSSKATGIKIGLYRYLPYWPMFAVFLFVSLLAGYVYLRYKTPLYETTARLLIKDEKKGAEESKTIEGLNTLSTKKIIENELEVVQSRTLIEQVVTNLHLYAPIFSEGKFVDASAYETSPIKIQVKDVSRLIPVKKVFFTFNSLDSTVELASGIYPTDQWVNTEFGVIRFDSDSSHFRSHDRKLYFSLVSPRKITSAIQQNLKVSATSRMSTILNLSIRDEVPKRGEDILNGLLQAYNAAIIDDKNSLAANTLAFVESRLAGIEKDLIAIEQRSQQYKSEKGAVDIGTQGKLFLETVSSNDQKLGEINMQLAVLDQIQNYVEAKDRASGIVPSTLGVNDPTLSTLVEKLYSKELEYESLKKTTSRNNPMLISVTDQIDKIKPSILENILNQRRSLIAGKVNMQSINSSFASMLQKIPTQERELININREQSIKNETYAFLLQKKEETALSHASTVSDSRIIDHAQSSDNPVSPKPNLIYASAFLFALIASFGIIVTKENLNRKIVFRHEIERLTSFPIIGEISSGVTKEQLVIGESKRTFIAEQFRKLRTTLKSIGINTKRKRILITSAISGEGKSFVAANLALSLALTNKKVVLIDFDLNNPSLNDKLNLAPQPGVTDYLTDQCEPDDIIFQTQINSNLYFIQTGKLPSNPSELILNGRTEELLNYLDGLFDYIVIDSAPVVPVTDAYSLSPFCDATLFVVRHKYTPKVLVERMDENNKMNTLNNVAIVFNGVKSRGFGSGNYGYGYGYGYVYQEKKVPARISKV